MIADLARTKQVSRRIAAEEREEQARKAEQAQRFRDGAALRTTNKPLTTGNGDEDPPPPSSIGAGPSHQHSTPMRKTPSVEEDDETDSLDSGTPLSVVGAHTSPCCRDNLLTYFLTGARET